MRDIETELDHPKSKGLGEQAIDLEDDEALEGIGLAAQKEAVLLQTALSRIADGTYGTCQNCGKRISDARLRAVLYTMLCKDCARAAQSDAA
nr:TraR/DksA C4-type zinc finger protein [uncultured Tateyamaria sp.]